MREARKSGDGETGGVTKCEKVKKECESVREK
jgi:hypothetical protein